MIHMITKEVFVLSRNMKNMMMFLNVACSLSRIFASGILIHIESTCYVGYVRSNCAAGKNAAVTK